jgi:hypothetical protein
MSVPSPSNSASSRRPLDAEAVRAARARVDRLAILYDSAFRVPVIGYRVGLDSLLGLIPVVGDIAGLAMGATLLVEAARIGVPRPLMLRMLGNAGADALLGLIPGVGDLFDFAFRSNRRNARLLREHLDRIDPVRSQAQTAGEWRLALAGIAILVLLLALAAIGVWHLLVA